MAASPADIPANGEGTRPGILIRPPDPNLPFKDSDVDLLEAKLELKIGEGKVKKIDLSPEKMEAYVELNDTADITKVLSSEISLNKGNPPLVMEQFDLMQVWCPYLIVKGLEFEEDMLEDTDSIEEMVKDHFESIVDGAEIESVELKGTEAKISFVQPQVALKFEPTVDFLEFTLHLEVGYSSPPEQKTMVLAVKGLPQRMSAKMCKHSLVNYFKKHSGFKAAECRIIESVAYLTFEDKSAVKSITANPPSANFFRGATLELSAAPLSQMLRTDEFGVTEDSSSAFKRSYSSASESSLINSMDSRHMQKELGRMKSSESSMNSQKGIAMMSPYTSIDSLSGDSQTTRCPDTLDPEESLHYSRMSRTSSTSSELSDSISGGMLRGDLSTVPEHPSAEIKSDNSTGGPVHFTVDNPPSADRGTTKVLIAKVPPTKSEFAIECYLGMLMHTECSVNKYGELFMATFPQPIDFKELKHKSSVKPLEEHELFFDLLDSTSIILVTTDNESLLNHHLLKMHFEKFVKESVQDVKIIPPDKALVYFTDPQSVEMVMTVSFDCHKIGGCQLTLTEYYDFMKESDSKAEEEADKVTPSQEAEALLKNEHRWKTINREIDDDYKDFWRANYHLRQLNGDLGSLNAHATMCSDQSGALQLKIDPVGGSETMDDWDQDVKNAVQDNFHRHFRKDSRTLPNYGFADLIEYAESAESQKVRVQVAGNLVTLTGEADAVTHVMDTIDRMTSQLFEIVPEERKFLRRYIKYLKKFCAYQLQNTKIPVEKIIFNYKQEIITVQANQEARELFWEVVHAEIEKIQEKTMPLEFDAFTLFETEKGAKRIEETIGMQVMYDLVSDPPTLCLLSTSKEKLKAIKTSLKKLINVKEMKIESMQKFRFCKDMKWKELVDKLQNDVFVLVTINEANQSVKVTGEHVVVDGVIDLIIKYLSEQASIEEHIVISSPKWMVISQNYWDDLEGIKKSIQGSNVKANWPQPGITGGHTDVVIVVKGDPPLVDKVKSELEALQKKVCEKEETLNRIPAVLLMIDNMEDTIRSLESKFKASIDVSVRKDDSPAAALPPMAPPKLCSAVCFNDVRISVYSGDFTKHGKVDVIINFIPPAPTHQEDNLKLLLAAGGVNLEPDFKKKVSQCDNPGEIFTSDPGQLQCNKLCHCMIPPWDCSVTNHLETSLSKTLHIIKRSTTVLFTSICSSPLNYPAEVFAENILTLLSTSSDLTVAVYVNEVAQAVKFEELFQKNNCKLLSKVQPSTKAARTRVIHDPISSYITLTKGDLLEKQADVYINSTNSTLDLKTGTLSNLLLKACGEELQKECSTHAPLKPEVVAVTKVKNVKANFVYHIALPDYKQEFHATRKLRGTVQAILRTAKNEGIQSLAIPSLGVGNLHYPAEVSAKVLYEEIIAFHGRNPNSNMKFHFVVFDQSTYQEFSKVYAQKMNSEPRKKGPVKKIKGQGKGQGGSTRLSIVNADISEEESEIIVNTTSQDMKLGNSAVAKALLKKAGPMLQTACDQLVQSGLRLDHGQVVVTKTFGSLQCKKIIHAHLPSRGDAKNDNLDFSTIIKKIVNQCLEKAENFSMKSISFPAFGFGQGGYSVHEVAEPMLTAFRDFGCQGPKSIEVIRVVIFDHNLHKQFFEFFTNFFQIDLSVPEKIVSTVRSKLSSKGGHGKRSVELQDNQDATAIDQPQGQHEEVDTMSLLIFKIFADSDKKCDDIAKALRESIKKKCIEDKIEKPNKVIVSLIDADIEEIQAIGNRLQVQVIVRPEMGKIEIFGETGQVKEAKIQIMQDVISEIEKSESELKIYKWQSEKDQDVESYSDNDSLKLERARAKELPALEMVIDDIEVIIDLTKMEERSIENGLVRKVMRVLINPSLKFPDTWAPQPVDASGKEETMRMFDVLEDSTEYKEVLDRFYDKTDATTVTIVSLKRVQNPNEYRRHMAFFEALSSKYPKKKIDVLRLFHGCGEKSIEPIAFQGFNRNFAATANAAYYGKGVYFALYSSYSAQAKYAAPNKDKDGHQSMFVCKFVVGEYTVGKPDMKVAPALKEGSNELHDTLVERKDNPTIFVALTDAQAYPEYLLTFKKK